MEWVLLSKVATQIKNRSSNSFKTFEEKKALFVFVFWAMQVKIIE